MDNNGKFEFLVELCINYFSLENQYMTREQTAEFINLALSNNWTKATYAQRSMKQNLKSILPILLECKGNLRYTNEYQKTFLHHFLDNYVSEKSDEHNYNYEFRHTKQKYFIEELIKNGACAIDLDRFQNSPLSIAIAKKRMDLIPALLTCMNVTNSREETILHVLIDRYVIDENDVNNYLDYVDLLCDLLINDELLLLINKKDHKGMTAAHFAAKHCYTEILEILKKSGADLIAQTNNGDNLLVILCKNLEFVRYVSCVNKVKINENRQLKSIKWLLEQGFDVNSKNEIGYTPLHYASGSQRLTVVKNLVKAGANVNATALDNANPLHFATMTGSYEIMKYLIECGTTISKNRVAHGFTLLHLVAYSYDKRKLKLLIDEYFDDANVRGDKDITPLHLASMEANHGIVTELIMNGADVDCRIKSKLYTPLHLASMRGEFKDIFDQNTLQETDNIVKNYYENRQHEHMNYSVTINKLLHAGADVNVRDNYDQTPLHFATQVKFGNHIVVNLLEAGAHVDAQDINGLLPIHNVLEIGSLMGLISLLDFGADINEIEMPDPNNFNKLGLRKLEVPKYLVFHAVKLKAVGLPVSSLYQPYLDDEKFKLYHEECLKEVKTLKIHMIMKNISIYKFMHMRSKKQCTFVNNLSFDLKNKFPIYHTVIRGTLRQALNRQSLLEPAKLAFDTITKIDWPDLCTDHLFSYLSNRYLRVLGETI